LCCRCGGRWGRGWRTGRPRRLGPDGAADRQGAEHQAQGPLARGERSGWGSARGGWHRGAIVSVFVPEHVTPGFPRCCWAADLGARAR
jgi:hypothetical protein